MSAQSRIILAQETLKGSKKGKDIFNAYASRVTNANNEVNGKENFEKGKKK